MDAMRGSRRRFVTSLVAGASTLVLGFDPVRRSWVTSASATTTIVTIPGLTPGSLFVDTATLTQFADDFGHIVHNMPIAVLKPASVNDVVVAVKFCRTHGIKVAARGQGHSTAGQAQCLAGLVIDSSTLNKIEQIGTGFAVLQAGVTWLEFLKESIPLGQKPAVITGLTGLSVGGTISMGGIGPASFRYGAIVDNVIELEVVTGDGVLRTCSATQNPFLFSTVVGGVGQFGIIVRAKVALVSVQAQARSYLINYFDFPTFFGDMNTLVSANKVDGVFALIVPNPAPFGGPWIYQINAVKNFPPGPPAQPPNDADILAGLHIPASGPPLGLIKSDSSTLAYDTQVDGLFAFLATPPPNGPGLGGLPHVWGDVFLPASKTEAFVPTALAAITPAELGIVLAPGVATGFILLFPVKNMFPKAIAFRLPNEKHVYLFDVLTSGLLPADPNYASNQIAKARTRFENARAVGGTLYPIGSTPMSKEDWERQYGLLYPIFSAAKEIFDPAHILTPGPGIF
jgi:cytokinin dehydrogenase